MSFFIELIGVFIALGLLYLLFHLLKNIFHLVVNSIFAFLLLFAINAIFGFGISINIFSILIVVLAGLPGFILVLLLHLLGLAF